MILKINGPQGQVCIYITMIFKDLLLQYRFANQRAFSGRENESLYEWLRSHDQDGRHDYK